MTKLKVTHGCGYPAVTGNLDIGEEGMTIFMHWYNSCINGDDYNPDLTALGVFVDYLEEKVEPSEVRDEALHWYKNRLNER